jgi:hypothetical protein
MSNTSTLGGGPTLWTDFGNRDIPTYGSMTPSFVQQHCSEANALWSRILGQSDISWNRYERPSDDWDDNRNSSRISLGDSREQGSSRFSSTITYSISDKLMMSCAGEDERRGRTGTGPSSTRRTRNEGNRWRRTSVRRHSRKSVEAAQEAGHDPERT